MSATQLGKLYEVSEKTIRDIWTGRTWVRETWRLDTSRSIPVKKIGRPKGRKDNKPRKRKEQKTGDKEKICAENFESLPITDKADQPGMTYVNFLLNSYPVSEKGPFSKKGIYILFKAAIPSMLASTERALSAQHSSDCNATAMARQPLRIRVGSREWDEFAPDGPAGEAAGYWAGPTCSRAAPRPSRVSAAFPAQGPCRARWWHFRWRCCWATS